MNNMFDVLFQSIKDKFPKLNWKLGSVVRSLIVDPLEQLSADVNSYVAKLTLATDLNNLLNNPVGRDEELDRWLVELGITLPAQPASTGTVAIICDALDPDLIVPAGTEFSWNDGTSLLAAETVTGDNLEKYGRNMFRMEVPVTSYSDHTTTLSSGCPLVWGSAPDTVIDIFVATPVSGGLRVNSVQAKAALIRAALQQPLVCGESAILATLIRKFGTTIVDVRVGKNINAPDSSGYVTPLYVKYASYPGADHLFVEPWLNSTQCGSPFKFEEHAPLFIPVSIQLHIGSTDVSQNMLEDICDYVNGSKLDATLSDAAVGAIVNDYGYTLKSGTLYTASVPVTGGTHAISQVGGLHVYTASGEKVLPKAMYCSLDNIKVY